MIEIKNLSKSYGDKQVVKNISSQIEKGSLTSFIGPNGAGKSTVLSMISRLIPRDSGEIIIDGRELAQWDSQELARKISILSQSNSSNLKLKVRELVEFGRFPHSGGRLNDLDKKKVDQALGYMELSDREDSYLDELSGGQRQRAYIAMILAQDTDYIFLDEPLNNLDMKHSVEIMKILKRLVRDLKKTIIIVIHDINFASKYSDNIVAFKDGEIVQDGSKDQVITDKILSSIYELDFRVEEANDMKLCIYY